MRHMSTWLDRLWIDLGVGTSVEVSLCFICLGLIQGFDIHLRDLRSLLFVLDSHTTTGNDGPIPWQQTARLPRRNLILTSSDIPRAQAWV